jgi:hypothetical protein
VLLVGYSWLDLGSRFWNLPDAVAFTLMCSGELAGTRGPFRTWSRVAWTVFAAAQWALLYSSLSR